MPGASTKFFYRTGRSDAARRRPVDREVHRQVYLGQRGWTVCWPEFAKMAYLRGYHGLSLKA